MGLYQSMAGRVRVKVVSADIPGFLAWVNGAGLVLEELECPDELTVRFTLSRPRLRELLALTRRRGESVTVEGRWGIYWKLASLGRRPVLTVGLAALTALALYLPSRVLVVEVEGNTTIPSNRIMETAARCGIGFGASRRAVRSEQVKNALLEAMPELSWAGVNTYGSRAVITVRQRAEEQTEESGPAVSSIVAARDGYVLSCRTEWGSAQCSPGQAVRAGEVLISGYTDCGLCITATRARGEVIALTQRDIRAVTPANCLKKGVPNREEVTYSLILGKSRINFDNNSGISPPGCGRMVTEYILTLPGDLALPVKLVKEVRTASGPEESAVPEARAESLLSGFAGGYLRQQMIAGDIVQAAETLSEADGLWILTGNYVCTEMIGREQAEQNGE